ncbi:DUF6515 family protein [Maribacter sp.]|nr:DUF6515 family protein [Maribacter sp.]
MKNKKIIFTVLTALLMLFAFTPEVAAQKKKNKVKKHVVKKHVKRSHKKHFRVKRARRTAHLRYRHLPRRGSTVKTIGVGHIGIRFGGKHFRFHNGVWYKPKGKRFLVVRAPLGARVRVLPLGFGRIVIGASPYFYHYGTYYVKTAGPQEEFEVVAAPIGAEVAALPNGYKVVKEKGMEFYKLDDVYYELRINENNEEYYIVVNDPTP